MSFEVQIIKDTSIPQEHCLSLCVSAAPSCGANSHYEQCGTPCPLTCSGLAPPEGCDRSAPCSEGCVCDDGFMLSDDKCVPLSECGCQYEGQYYLSGQVQM